MHKKNKFLILSIIIGIFAVTAIISIFHRGTKQELPSPSVLVEIAPVKETLMAPTLVTYGVVNFEPNHSQQLILQAETVVKQLLVSPGQSVKKGDRLLQVVPSTGAQLNLDNAKITVDYAQKELDRLSNLYQQYLATNAELQTAQQNLAKAKAALNILLLQKQGQTLRADFDGTIVTIAAQPGQIVPASSPLMTIADNHYLQVRLGVEAEDLSQVRTGQSVVISALHNGPTPFKTTLQKITSQVDSSTGLIDVIAPLNGATGFILGDTVRGKIWLKPPQNTLVIPHSAILYKEKNAYVFVVKQNKAEQRWITIGYDDGNFASILQGLNLGESVVISGNYELTNGSPVREEPSP